MDTAPFMFGKLFGACLEVIWRLSEEHSISVQ